MTRRTATLSTAGVVLVVLLCVALLLPVPYVTLRPGPTRDVLAAPGGTPVVEIDGHRTYPTDGSLSLTTVSVTSADQDLGLLDAFRAWFEPDVAIVPRDAIYPPDQTPEQAEQESAAQMAGSQEVAAVAALRLLGRDVAETDVVTGITEGAPADGVLEVGDVLVSADGQTIDSATQLTSIIQDREPGDTVDITVRRKGKTRELTVGTEASPDDPGTAVVGIELGVVDYDLPFDVSINLGADIGGPSAGTVFALAIYDQLTPGSLTGGADVAGTGEIDAAGTVGPIGGIQQKILGAENAGASVFLVPRANCEEATAADADPGDITLVEVATLGGAVEALEMLADDPDAEVPTCG